MLAWPLVPLVPLIVLAYAGMALGYTFLSGADEALFYESLQTSGRSAEYPRLTGRVNALVTGAMALGNALSGLLATIDLIIPFLAGELCIVAMLGIVLTFIEPQSQAQAAGEARKPYREILRQSIALLAVRPTLRYPVFYLALVPLAAFFLESLFVQPQALLLGVPVAGIGLLIMAGQVINMLGAAWSQPIAERLGESRLLYLAPVVIVLSLVLLAALQVFSALLLIGVVGFVTALLRPLVMSRIQTEVTDEIRATMLSMQSLISTFMMAVSEPILGYVGDQAGLPTVYLVLAGALGLLSLWLFWSSRLHFPKNAISIV